MKTTCFLLATGLLAVTAAAQDVEYNPTPAVVYQAPVTYQAPVVYNAPVVYQAPMYYGTPDTSGASEPAACAPTCYAAASTAAYIQSCAQPACYQPASCGNSVQVIGFGCGQAGQQGYYFRLRR